MWSQFHYGSIQTVIAGPPHSGKSVVSIPLWFDSNEIEVLTDIEWG